MPGGKVLIRRTGPILDGQTRGVVSRMMTAAKQEIGQQLVTEVQQRLDRVLVNPTGYYRSQIDWTINQGNGAVIVHDRGVVYGPWLEGTGSRNYPATRFRGYATFQKTMQAVQERVPELAQKHVTVAVKTLS